MSLHVFLGLVIMFFAVMLIYARVTKWKRYKSEQDYTDNDIKKHQRKLIIYSIIFLLGLIELFVEIL